MAGSSVVAPYYCMKSLTDSSFRNPCFLFTNGYLLYIYKHKLFKYMVYELHKIYILRVLLLRLHNENSLLCCILTFL